MLIFEADTELNKLQNPKNQKSNKNQIQIFNLQILAFLGVTSVY